jgi:hypothetical protein
MIAEYLERAIRFEQMAEEVTDLKFKGSLLQQAAAYRKLPEQRAKKLNIPCQSNRHNQTETLPGIPAPCRPN